MYSISRSTYFTYEHIRGKEIFCAKDTQRSSTGVIIKVTYRCDITVSGQGVLNPELLYIGDYGGSSGGGDLLRWALPVVKKSAHKSSAQKRE